MALMVREVHAAGYRSLRSIHFPFDRLTVFVGANGVGKTNLYRALQLIQASAAGTLSRELAAEGGMESALRAGKRSGGQQARITVGADFAPYAGGERAYGYEASVGLGAPRPGDGDRRVPASAAFLYEPSFPTAPCAIWRLPARSSPIACRPSSPSTSRRRACIRICRSRWPA